MSLLLAAWLLGRGVKPRPSRSLITVALVTLAVLIVLAGVVFGAPKPDDSPVPTYVPTTAVDR